MAKKILFIITQSEMGGAQKYVYETAVRLDRGQYDIMVAAGPKGNWELLERLDKVGVKTRKLWHLKRNINPLFDFAGIWQIYRLIKKEKPDFVYLHSSKAGVIGSIAAVIYRRWKSSPKIIYRIGGWAFNEKVSFIKKWLYVLTERITALLKDVIVVNSEADKKAAIARNICLERKIKVIYNGIDIDNMKFLDKNDARKSLSEKFSLILPTPGSGKIAVSGSRQSSRFLVGTIANFYSNKGLLYLIEAARILSNDKLIFIVIGDGAERKELEEMIKKYNLENNFFLLGSMADAHKYLKAFDLFVLPSIKEGMPWTVLEAMAAGLSIVATKVGGVSEMVENGKSGILVEPQNSQELVVAIKETVSDDNLRKFLGDNAFSAVKEKFSLVEMLRKTRDLFN
ncbi:MAG: glycosyltransferase family 4 protein [Patescibacteria group bacterium]